MKNTHPQSIITKILIAILCLIALPAFADNYIRANQVGYIAGTSARAYLMSTDTIANAAFSVNDINGNPVAAGTVGNMSGKWGKYKIYPFDFTVAAVGQYTLAVTVNNNNLVATKINIDAAAKLYSNLLGNTLSFYQTQRDGPNFIASPLRTDAAHLNDKNAVVYFSPNFDDNDDITAKLKPTGANIDVTGGWFDAGDYLKFVQTHSYTVALMLIGIRDFPNQLGISALNSNFINEAKFGLDWLQKMWDDENKILYYQVGIGTDFNNYNFQSDHDIWRLPQADDTYGGNDPTYQYIRNRPVFVPCQPDGQNCGKKISPNLAGRLAADFALCFTVFKNTDPTYANQCLLSAEHIYDLANIKPTGNLLTTAPYDFYPETAWRDDLELGATELYFALQSGNLPAGLLHTDPNYYLKQAATWASAYINGPNDQSDTLNLYDVSGLAHFELYRAMSLAGNPSLAVTQAQLLQDMAAQMKASLSNDPFGTPIAWSNSDTVSHVTGLSVMAAEYYYLTKDKNYANYSRRWMDNALGANPWGVSFVTGAGMVFPYCMQHQIANMIGSTNGSPPILAGAVVEGPTNTASSGTLPNMVPCNNNVYQPFNANGALYQDNVQSYSTNEPAIDLTAASMLMFAWQIAGAPENIVK